MSDRIAVMYGGKILEMAERQQLLDGPRHPYTQALLSAAVLGSWQGQVDEIVLEGDPPSPIRLLPAASSTPAAPLPDLFAKWQSQSSRRWRRGTWPRVTLYTAYPWIKRRSRVG